jgi:membrane protein YdbS with pleckstrin-like domain
MKQLVATLKRVVLQGLRVPPEPSPPAGAPGSLRVFRAGRNFWNLRLLAWGSKQVSAAFGILVSVAFIQEIDWQQAARAVRPPVAASAAASAERAAVGTTGPVTAKAPARPARQRRKFGTEFDSRAERQAPGLPPRPGLGVLADLIAPPFFFQLASQVPAKLVIWLQLAEALAVGGYLLQLPFTLMVARLDYSCRWYLVTDRSLRIRTGLVVVQESTMSFANLQQVEIKQGPLQRWLGLADLRVQSAGGGGGQHETQPGDSLHTGIFHGVENAAEIRDLILDRLRQFRQAGLGDPDDPVHPAEPAPPSDTFAAAQEMLAEARALRTALTPGPVNRA